MDMCGDGKEMASVWLQNGYWSMHYNQDSVWTFIAKHTHAWNHFQKSV